MSEARVGTTSGAARIGGVSLRAEIGAFSVAGLLHLLHDARKSGVLQFECEREEKVVYFSRGEVVFAESNCPEDRLGEALLRADMIDAQGLALAESRYHPRTRFGKIVVELGLLSPRELWTGVKVQVEQIVRSLFAYDSGSVEFREGDVEPDNVVRLRLPTGRLIDEGLRDRTVVEEFRCRLELGQASLRAVAGEPPVDGDAAQRVWSILGEAHRLRALRAACDLGDGRLMRTLQRLVEAGHVAIEEPADDALREKVECYAKLLCELAVPLVALDGAGALAERLNRMLGESADAGRARLGDPPFTTAAILDTEGVFRSARALPGDPAGRIEEALEEAVAYLEFELKNHPEIDDAAGFLAAVAPLRAMLDG